MAELRQHHSAASGAQDEGHFVTAAVIWDGDKPSDCQDDHGDRPGIRVPDRGPMPWQVTIGLCRSNVGYRKWVGAFNLSGNTMNNLDSSIRVECDSGCRPDESPRRFYLGNRKIEIDEIVDRWFGHDHVYFKVRGDDDCIYILHHAQAEYRWTLKMFDSGKLKDYCPASTSPGPVQGRVH